MNASIPAALLLVLLAGGWLLGRRRPRPFLRSTDTSAVAALNRGQIERLQAALSSPVASPLLAPESPSQTAPDSATAPAAIATLPGFLVSVAPAAEARTTGLPLQARERRIRLRQLQAWMAGSREQRLQAMATARQSNRRDVLPLLRLGLRDPDPAVMAAAAAAMDRFRGRSAAQGPAGSDAAARRHGPQTARVASPEPRRVLRTR